ncbi:MAG: beta strand repeat-containing protein, partial [Rhodoferax sp.]
APGATLTLSAAIANSNVNIELSDGAKLVLTKDLAYTLGTLKVGLTGGTTTSAATLDMAAAGAVTLNLSALDMGNDANLKTNLNTLTVSNWVSGSDHLNVSAFTNYASPAPTQNTLGVEPLKRITLGSNAANLTYWSRSGSELLAGGATSFTYWDGPATNTTSIEGGASTWDGTRTNWTTVDGSINGTWPAGQTANFKATGGTVTISGTQSIGGLAFAVDNYTLGGSGALALASDASITNTNTGTGINTVAVGMDSVDTTPRALTLEDAGKLAISGNLGSNVSNLTKNGAGTTTLSGTNTYSGTTTISAGTLKLGSANALPSASAVTVASGATLDINGKTLTRTDLSLLGTLAMGTNGNLTLSGTNNSLSTVTGSGTIQLAANAKLTLTGAVDSNVTIELGAGATLALSSSVDRTLGKLKVTGSTATLDMGSGSITLTLSELDMGTGAMTVSKWVSGTNHLKVSAFTNYTSPAPTQNTLGLEPLKRIALGSNAASQTYWSSTSNELLAAGATSFTYWDGPATNNTFIEGGAGTWDSTRTNWTTVDGSVNGSWTAGQTANFSAGSGTVTVSGTQSIGGLSFAVSGYTLSGSGALALASDASITNTNTGTGINTVAVGMDSADATTRALTLDDAGTLTISGTLGTKVGAITKKGAGTTTLSGANSYTGITTVSEGTLLVNGAQINASGSVNVNSGATLGGSGTVGGFTIVGSGGILTPGGSSSVGSMAELHFESGLQLNDGSTTHIDLAAVGALRDGKNDLLDVKGTLTLGGTLNLRGATGLSSIGTYVLATYSSRAGTFSTVNLPTGYVGSVEYNDTLKQVRLVPYSRLRIGQISNGATGSFSFVISQSQ